MKFCLVCEKEFNENCLKNCISLKCMFKGKDYISKILIKLFKNLHFINYF